MQYQRFTLSDCKDIELENLNLWPKLNSFVLQFRFQYFIGGKALVETELKSGLTHLNRLYS